MANSRQDTNDNIVPGNNARVQRDDDEVERAPSADLDNLKSDRQRYDKVDKELAKYVADEAFEISEEENSRLRKLIDKRVLVIMITTYFLQAIDKGTMSFASIMGIIEDTNLKGQEVGQIPYPLHHDNLEGKS